MIGARRFRRQGMGPPAARADRHMEAVRAGLSAGVDTLSLGLADHVSAARRAALVGRGFDDMRRRYDANLTKEKAQDRYDATHHPVATKVGQVGATVLGLAAGPARIGATALTRLPGAARLTLNEAAAIGAAGGAAGGGMQVVTDIATGRRSSAGDTVGAVVGGVAGAAALPFGPRAASAASGWTTSAAQDYLNGRPIALDRAGQAALSGSVIGGAVADAGADAANKLSIKAKGKLGEAMGEARSAVNGQRRELGPKTRDYIPDEMGDPSKTYWYPDGRSGSTRFEDKFGHRAEVSKNQLLAQSRLGDDFKLYHFLVEDVGSAASVPAGAGTSQLNDLARRRRQER